MRALVRIATLVASVPCTLVAQGVTVHSTTDIHMFGALGSIVGAAAALGGAKLHDVQSTSYVSGHRMRSESEATGTIIDADAGAITTLDNKQKTYTTMTFAEMAAAMDQAMKSGRQSMQQDRTDRAKSTRDAGSDDVTVKYHVDVTRPGQHERIAGYDAERVFITIALEGESAREGEKPQDVGSMVFLLDQWMSRDAPQIAALEEFQRAYAQKAGQAFRPQVAALQSAFASDPRIKDGFEAAGKELQKVPGIPLRSVTYVALVPAGQSFDRNLVLGDAAAASKSDTARKDDKAKGGGFKGLLGAIKSAAEDANKQQSADNNAPPPPPKQATLMSLRNEVTSIAQGVPASTFAVPSGYREIKPRLGAGG